MYLARGSSRPGSPQKEFDSRGQPLKYCPRCNFTFADSQDVCDFDGAELISAPEPPSHSSRPSLLRRSLKSPVLLAFVGLIAVVGSAFLIGYYEVVNQTTSMVKTQPSPAVSGPALPAAQDTRSSAVNQPGSQEDNRRSTQSLTRKPRIAPATVARIRRQPRNAPKGSEVARRTASPQTAIKKDPILTAMLKTTWRVLKRPFSF
jgi:hypothetical protein